MGMEAPKNRFEQHNKPEDVEGARQHTKESLAAEAGMTVEGLDSLRREGDAVVGAVNGVEVKAVCKFAPDAQFGKEWSATIDGQDLGKAAASKLHSLLSNAMERRDYVNVQASERTQGMVESGTLSDALSKVVGTRNAAWVLGQG